MTCTSSPIFFAYGHGSSQPQPQHRDNLRERRLRMERTLGNTTCSKGHVHPPWNTTGVLRIAKCESVCGFCQKETKTAANLRKHVAIHIKNEGLNLSIAEGSSGRGRLEMPQSLDQSTNPPSSSRLASTSSDSEGPSRSHTSTPRRRPIPPAPSSDPSAAFSPSQVLMSMHQHHSYPIPSQPNPPLQNAVTTFYPSNPSHPTTYGINTLFPNPNAQNDPFHSLREHKIRTKSAWTVIPASEGFAILDYCKSQSSAVSIDTSPGAGSGSGIGVRIGGGGNLGGEGTSRTPCYNRETIFDEEWQAHIRDVHGVYLIWPETWMRRIEVLDLEPFGGDIGGVNEVIMES